MATVVSKLSLAELEKRVKETSAAHQKAEKELMKIVNKKVEPAKGRRLFADVKEKHQEFLSYFDELCKRKGIPVK